MQPLGTKGYPTGVGNPIIGMSGNPIDIRRSGMPSPERNSVTLKLSQDPIKTLKYTPREDKKGAFPYPHPHHQPPTLPTAPESSQDVSRPTRKQLGPLNAALPIPLLPTLEKTLLTSSASHDQISPPIAASASGIPVVSPPSSFPTCAFNKRPSHQVPISRMSGVLCSAKGVEAPRGESQVVGSVGG